MDRNRRLLLIAAAFVASILGVAALSVVLVWPSPQRHGKETLHPPLEELPEVPVHRMSRQEPTPSKAIDGNSTPQKTRHAVAPRPLIPQQLAAAFDESRGTIPRMMAVDALSHEQPAEVLVALRWLLKNPAEDEALRNNVANKLRECGEEHLADDLTEMLWDEKETPKWRNYCVQHLYNCYEEKTDTAILDTLFKAADPTQTDEKLGIPGTPTAIGLDLLR